MVAVTCAAFAFSASIVCMAASVIMRFAVPLRLGSTSSADGATVTGETDEKALPGALTAITETLSQSELAASGEVATEDADTRPGWPRWTLGLLIVAALGATALGVAAVWRSERDQAGEQLLAVSESKAREITAWHAERLRDASWIQKDREIEANWLIWHFSHAPGAMDALAQQLTRYLDGSQFQRVALFNASGGAVWRSGGPDHAEDRRLGEPRRGLRRRARPR